MRKVIRMDHRTISAGHRIKEIAELHGVSLNRLVEKTGIGYGTLQGILTGAREPKLSHLYAIADALDTTVIDLIGTRAARTDRIAS